MGEEKSFDKIKYIRNYNKEHYKRFVAELPKDLSLEFENKLKKENISKAQFLKKSVEEYLKK